MLHYRRQGNREGQTLLFLHGFMGRGDDWEPLVHRLDRDFDCLTPDLPGHGQSISLSGNTYTMGGAADALLALLTAAGVESCSMVGYSMGARLALFMAMKEPVRLRHLVLISGTPGLRTREERRARAALDARRARAIEEDMVGFIQRWQELSMFKSLQKRPDLVRNRMESQRRNQPAELARSLRLMGTGSQPSLWEELVNLKVPVLAVVGALDRKFADIAERMARLTPIVCPAIIPDAGHAVHLEKPQEVVRALLAFVKPGSRTAR